MISYSSSNRWPLTAAIVLGWATLAFSCTEAHPLRSDEVASVSHLGSGDVLGCELGRGYATPVLRMDVPGACVLVYLHYSTDRTSGYWGELLWQAQGEIALGAIRTVAYDCETWHARVREGMGVDSGSEVTEAGGYFNVEHGPSWGQLLLSGDMFVTLPGTDETHRIMIDEHRTFLVGSCQP